MSDAPATAPPTVESALAAAVRILGHAEGETNLALMERLEHLADSWIGIAALLMQREERV